MISFFLVFILKFDLEMMEGWVLLVKMLLELELFESLEVVVGLLQVISSKIRKCQDNTKS